MSKSKNTSGPIKEGIMKGNIRRIAAAELSAPPKAIKKPKQSSDTFALLTYVSENL